MIDRYVSEIRKEILSVERPFHTIYIGGGNPGKIGKENLISLLEVTMRNSRAEEVTVELNPEDVGPWINELSGLVDRISVGIQSMNQQVLSYLGRNVTVKENIEALEILASSKFSFNADIITSVPSFSVDDTLSDIRKIASYEPDHISFYSLVYEEGTRFFPLYEKRDEDYEVDCLTEGWKLLSSLGYEHYEVSNFARKGKYAKHNLVYWNLGEYLGLGTSAESHLGADPYYSMRSDQSVEEFINRAEYDVEKLEEEDLMIEYIMVALRTEWGIDKKRFSSLFSVSFDSLLEKVRKEIRPECFKDNENAFSLTEEGFMVLDDIVRNIVIASC